MTNTKDQGPAPEDEWVMRPDLQQRYAAAMHAMQTGVAMMLQYNPHSTAPKHLRVGVNSALVSHAALVKLLYRKGLFTRDEYDTALVEQVEAEAASYAAEVSATLGGSVKLV